MRKILLSFLLALVLSGCMMGPDYRRPTIETPKSWRFEEKEAREISNAAWWEQFNDPILNELIQVALKENKDLKIATARVEEFMGLTEATLEGAKLRLRPIVMTSLAFGFGILPLVLASGAGAGAQKAIGTGALGGVVTATFLVTFFAPLFYVRIEKTFGKSRKNKAAKTDGANSSQEDK